MTNLTVLNFSDKSIRFERRGDRVWVNLTDMAKATGKQVNDYTRSKSASEFLAELEICRENFLHKYACTLSLIDFAEAFSIFAKIEKAKKARGGNNEPSGIIYIISNGSKYYKLGFSKNVKQRIKSLQTANGRTVKLVKMFEGSLESEKKLHKLLKKFNINGEWYKKDILEIVTQELIDSLNNNNKNVYSCCSLVIENNQNETLEKQGVWAISAASIDFAEWCGDEKLENWVAKRCGEMKTPATNTQNGMSQLSRLLKT